MKKLFILTALLIAAITGKAQYQQPNDCFNPHPLGQGDTCVYDISVSTPEYWFSFTADTIGAIITIANDTNQNVGHVHRIIVFAGSCDGLIAIDSADVIAPSDSIILGLNNLIIGNAYYIVGKTAISVCPELRCISNAYFNICITTPMTPVMCYAYSANATSATECCGSIRTCPRTICVGTSMTFFT